MEIHNKSGWHSWEPFRFKRSCGSRHPRSITEPRNPDPCSYNYVTAARKKTTAIKKIGTAVLKHDTTTQKTRADDINRNHLGLWEPWNPGTPKPWQKPECPTPQLNKADTVANYKDTEATDKSTQHITRKKHGINGSPLGLCEPSGPSDPSDITDARPSPTAVKKSLLQLQEKQLLKKGKRKQGRIVLIGRFSLPRRNSRFLGCFSTPGRDSSFPVRNVGQPE